MALGPAGPAPAPRPPPSDDVLHAGVEAGPPLLPARDFLLQLPLPSSCGEGDLPPPSNTHKYYATGQLLLLKEKEVLKPAGVARAGYP